jgi:phosphatidylserine decarboxylase
MGQNKGVSAEIFMKNVVVIDRKTGRKEQEKIMGHSLILFIYSAPWPFKIFGLILQVLLCHFHGVSRLYGQYQKSRLSQKNILPFIKKYNVDTREFAHSLLTFKSFNDFFIRTLKKTARPLDSRPHHALCPADGRYLAFQNTKHVKDFWIKGKKFDLDLLHKLFIYCIV